MRLPARIRASIAAILAVLFIETTPAQTDRAAACASLADQKLDRTTIMAAQAVTSGS